MIQAATDNTGDTTPPLPNSFDHMIDLRRSSASDAGQYP
jgi:hypothetical protein